MTKSLQAPELGELKELSASSPSASAFFHDLANRKNDQRVTKVDQMLNRLRDFNVKRSEVIGLFRRLEGLGYGQFVEGRRQHPSRFVWTASLVGVGRAAQGQDATINPVQMDAEIDGNGAETREYVFPLRSRMDATFTVPVDLTEREVERLCAFLKTLAFPE